MEMKSTSFSVGSIIMLQIDYKYQYPPLLFTVATLWADFLILVRHYGSAHGATLWVDFATLWVRCDIMGRFCDIMGQVRHYGSIATLWGSTSVGESSC